MSAPDTNLKRQTRRHRPALWGIAFAMLVAAVAALFAVTRNEPLVEDQAAPAIEGG